MQGFVFKDGFYVPKGDKKETQKEKMLRVINKQGWEFPMASVHMQFATEEEDEFVNEYEDMKQGAGDPGKDYVVLRQQGEMQGEHIKKLEESVQYLISKIESMEATAQSGN
ncbi:hypothetical protein Moror_8461 [Moniliophthora roreri MCA 2997]|uniref:Uncharacterized protein n=2 Tax=Moniliophthora roreri TaxID=221103 RepID=V2XP85_MONRO|nr:hypothetical protein Moror_8461 [Moniliophthora roreri MCA 2997]